MIMITEDYVSYETAKLLKEKGFDERVKSYYTESGLEGYMLALKATKNTELGDGFISRPTLQMVMKWLREVQALNIYARGVWKDVEVQYCDWEPAVVGYEWFVESLTDDAYSKMSVEQFLTYEEACESAIKYCLENLI